MITIFLSAGIGFCLGILFSIYLATTGIYGGLDKNDRNREANK